MKKRRTERGITIVSRRGLEYLHVRVGQFHRQPALAQKDFRLKPGAWKKARAWRDAKRAELGL